MEGKHIHIESDTKLLIKIRQAVKDELFSNCGSLRRYLFIKFFVYGGLTIILYSLLYQNLSGFLFVLTYIILGLSTLLLALNFAHDFSHNAVFKIRSWNNLGYISIFTIVGAHAEPWRERHIHDHHFAPNVKEYDTDLQITNVIRVDSEMQHRWFHRFQHLYAPIAYCIYSLYWMFIKDFIVLKQTIHHEGFKLSYLLSFVAQKIFYFSYILILPLLLSGQPTKNVVLGFIIMHLVQSVFLLFTFFITHHVMQTSYPRVNDKGVIQSSWLMNQVGSSNDINPFSTLANFIFGGFNNHIAHHLFPNIHHMYYPWLNRILYRILKSHGILPNKTTYIGGVVSHLKLLKKLSLANELDLIK